MADHDLPTEHKLSFCEMLFTKALAPYFINVHETNPNGFNSSTPNHGLWELFVYDKSDPRRSSIAGSRIVRSKFHDAVQYLGKHLRGLDSKRPSVGSMEAMGGALKGGSATSQEVLTYIKDKELSSQESSLFNLFFNIVIDGSTDSDGKRHSVSIADYKRDASTPTPTTASTPTPTPTTASTDKYNLSVKTFNKLDFSLSGELLTNVKSQKGGKFEKLVLVATYLPLLGNDRLSTETNQKFKIYTRSEHISESLESNIYMEHSKRDAQQNLGDSNAIGGGLKGGANEDEMRNASLRIALEMVFENPIEEIQEVVEVVSPLEFAEYLACNPAKSRLATPVSNIATLTALPQNTWRQLSDGSYEQWTPQGYKPLSKEDCDNLLNGTCAGSSIKEGVCKNFMNAVNNNNAEALVKLLGEAEIWENNTATYSLNKLHPATVIRILNALHFGTKNGPFGKRVCSVEEWKTECIKGTKLQNAVLSDNVKAYLQHLVNFVNSNPSLIDPSKRPIAAMTSAATPDALKIRGLFYAGEALSHGSSAPLNFSQVRQAVSATCGAVNLSSVHVPYATAFGAVQLGGQKGGNHLYTQSSQAQLSLGSGIQALLSQVLSGLKSTQYGLSAEDEAKINQKVTNLTALEQEIYATIMDLNEKRLALQCGANCHSQVASTQERLMQLSSTYDRKAPCLQELCEQLRMLLAQQQNTAGCQPIQ